ncbi:major facilitator superfamily transporter [Colletotrichum higginsianum]|uniref:Major facilitator superfamily transporter n=2 Tax=Colletotrichum higginsianum TaxID=80884 RepID=H1VFC7_COLHI|nr:Major facilitator superfamily transporter [Colletotrichum higginsianum IMI 349063]OBR09565.1 Major facilitator superfamily transporter [Colletotrichum higginsianum IMI 349063]TIC95308.1 Dityrosine transporter 1 [Colletotrichum higginsianum]CCF38930.1 major facilitator superfamily transporter [Colletotrichum higginsianum]
MSREQHDGKPEPTGGDGPGSPDLAPATSNAEKDVSILPAVDDNAGLSRQDTEAIYARFKPARKRLVTAVVACGGVASTVSSLLLLAAIPEIAADLGTTGSIINISNAIYILFMGLSTLFWGPMSQVYGRKWPCIISASTFFAFCVGTALSPNLAAFFVFRMLSAFTGTAYLVLGSACISDIYKPTERGTALAWFLNGTLIGQSFGPFIGGVIVTFHSWRALFWFQSALGGLTAILAVSFLPETSHRRRADELKGLGPKATVVQVWQWANPFRVLALLLIPKLFVAGIAAASLVWNMQALLTPIRYVINPRFNLTSPLQSGLFFLAPGCGFFFGTYAGGRWADRTVRLWVKRRGRRVPEDRLRSSFVAMGAVIPICIIIYGWAIEKEKGGIPLPVICMFVQGFAQVIAFPSINAYCLDVFKGRSAEVIAGNYFFRYAIAAVGTAACLPAIESIGVGWFSTITALFVFFSTAAVYLVVIIASKEDYKAHGEQV